MLSYIVDLRRSPSLFFIPLVPYPPLRGTSFHRKEGVSTQAPSLGRGCRAQRGGVGFLFWAAKPPPLCLPLSGKGDRAAVDRVLSLMAYLRRSPSLFFIPPSPSNLRPFRAPPSIGRRECPRKPLPLEGAAERSEAGLASFFGRRSGATVKRTLVQHAPLGKATDTREM